MNIRMNFNRHDFWVGVFWKKRWSQERDWEMVIYICIIPCFPVKIELPCQPLQ